MRRLLAAVLPLALLAACGGTTNAADRDKETLTVLAAASLTETFTAIADRFEAEHRGVDVRLVFDSSATLATQVVQGAPGDVIATADERTMRIVEDAGLTATEPRAFATNRLVLVVPAANPAGISGLVDLARPEVSFVSCAESAPCGALATALLQEHAIDATARSLEVDVKAVLTKVMLDEADAGLVYATDAAAAGDAVQSIEIADSRAAVTDYLVAPLREAGQPELARAWVELMLSAAGQDVLADAGFGPP